MKKDIQFGTVTIFLPDENSREFLVFQDLAELFGVEYNSDAVKMLKKKLKELNNLKPKPNIDYEADMVDIYTTSADTIFKVAECINSLTIEKFQVSLSAEQKAKILHDLKVWKRPKPQKWQVGDIFSIRLSDNTFVFGQILPKGDYSNICALFLLRKNDQDYSTDFARFIDELKQTKILTVLGVSMNFFNNGTYKIIGHTIPLVDQSMRLHKNTSYGSGVLKDLAEVYFGLKPWNILYRENYYDGLLMDGLVRPNNTIVLTPDERLKYRKQLGHNS